MSFSSRLKERREFLGLKQIELADMLGVTPGAIGNYESGFSSPKSDILYKLFDALRCDANYLFQDSFKSIKSDDLFETREISLVKKYRKLDTRGKDMVETVVEKEFVNCMNEKDIVKKDTGFIEIPLSVYKVSAGTGFALDDLGTWETITVKDTPLTRRVAFAVTVQGDSMEPEFSDGDCVFVQQTSDIDIGEIGIFCVNDLSYMKKRGNNKLISLNDSYDDITVGEYDTVTCFGKVIGKL